MHLWYLCSAIVTGSIYVEASLYEARVNPIALSGNAATVVEVVVAVGATATVSFGCNQPMFSFSPATVANNGTVTVSFAGFEGLANLVIVVDDGELVVNKTVPLFIDKAIGDQSLSRVQVPGHEDASSCDAVAVDTTVALGNQGTVASNKLKVQLDYTECPQGFFLTGKPGPGGRCLPVPLVDECSLGTHNCATDYFCTDTALSFTCTQIPKIVQVASNYVTKMVLYNNGKIVSWGQNTYGQLGHSASLTTFTDQPTIAYPAGSGAVKIEAFDSYGFVIFSDQRVESFGLNSLGQLGRSENRGTTTPTPSHGEVYPAGSGEKVCFGRASDAIFMLFADGRLDGWGSNQYGELGLPTASQEHAPFTVFATGVRVVSIGKSKITHVVKTDGEWVAFGTASSTGLYESLNFFGNFLPKTTVLKAAPWASDFVSVSCKYSCLVIRNDGTVLFWGWRNIFPWPGATALSGTTASPTTNSKTYNIHSSTLSSVAFAPPFDPSTWGHCILTTQGTVKCAGCNRYGIVADHSIHSSCTMANIHAAHPATDYPTITSLGTDVVGLGFGAALKADGSLWVWGKHHAGQLTNQRANTSPACACYATPQPVDLSSAALPP